MHSRIFCLSIYWFISVWSHYRINRVKAVFLSHLWFALTPILDKWCLERTHFYFLLLQYSDKYGNSTNDFSLEYQYVFTYFLVKYADLSLIGGIITIWKIVRWYFKGEGVATCVHQGIKRWQSPKPQNIITENTYWENGFKKL